MTVELAFLAKLWKILLVFEGQNREQAQFWEQRENQKLKAALLRGE
jgi:hypothetical protein